jgi:hypothetical protein
MSQNPYDAGARREFTAGDELLDLKRKLSAQKRQINDLEFARDVFSLAVDVLQGKQCTPAERKVLTELESSLRRLGDDPAYYEVYKSEDGWTDVFGMNPALVDAVNEWTKDLDR